jgi:hypothetical protein
MRSPAKRQTVQYTTWVKPSVKAELQHIAQAEGLTLSRTGAAALEEWLARRSHIQHRGIFQPMIEQAIAKQMRAYSSRLATLLVRDLFVNEQTRAIAYNTLRKPPGLTLTDEAIDKIMEGSKNTAKRNIARVDPELIPVIGAIETWLEQGVSTAHE